MKSKYRMKKIVLSLVFLFTGLCVVLAQDDSIPAPTKKPLERKPFESGIFIDNQTVEVPTGKTLEFVLQHRFGTIQNHWEDLYGIWGASNIRLGLNFSITNNVLVGLGTTKNGRVQDLSVKYTFLHQRKGGFPLTIGYFGDLGINCTNESNYGEGYKFNDRLSYYHEFMFARRFCKMFSMQIGFAYTHFNKVDSTSRNDNFAINLLARLKVSPQSSIVLTVSQPFVINYDPAFLVRDGYNWMEVSSGTPYMNCGLGWEISTSTHAFQVFIAAAQGIVPQYVTQYNSNNFFNGQILIGLNITRLWSF
jgi:hypothetical protein